MLQREDMMELTRRMNLARNCFTRIAGCYIDEEGEIDGTFNTSFLKLTPSDKEKKLRIAKAIPFSETNVNLKEYEFPGEARESRNMWKLLTMVNSSDLKNDALLDLYYEAVSDHYQPGYPYGIYFFSGIYDIPVKASDHTQIGESEEIYDFLIGAICPITEEYEAEEPQCGFLFPSFSDRSADISHIAIFERKVKSEEGDLLRRMFGTR